MPFVRLCVAVDPGLDVEAWEMATEVTHSGVQLGQVLVYSVSN